MRDDLIPEEHDIVYQALKRLTDKEMFDRTFRLRRAVQLNMTKEVLPPEEWIPLEKVLGMGTCSLLYRTCLIYGDT
jgi:ubiquinol-cytochrome c reductase subunit 7